MSRVRIVGGAWRSRLLEVAAVPGLRPSPDRVRETLFNWLGQRLDGLRCLDLFAGTGVLGFEAASRGAEQVVMVERDASAYRLLGDNISRLGAGAVRAVRADAVKFLAEHHEPFDLIFLDPPYRQNWLERVAPMLERLTHPGTLIYAEAEHAVDALGPWRSVKQGVAGQVHYQLMARPDPDSDSDNPACDQGDAA